MSDCTSDVLVNNFSVKQIVSNIKYRVKDKLSYIDNLPIYEGKPPREQMKALVWRDFRVNFLIDDTKNIKQYYTRKQDWRISLDFDCYMLGIDELDQFISTLGFEQVYINDPVTYNYYIDNCDFTDYFLTEQRINRTAITIIVSPVI